MDSLRVRAFAKLNLGLRVVGRRQDGYHLLQSTMAAVDLFDTVTLSLGSRGMTVSCQPDLGIPPERNLARQAVEAVLARTGVQAGVHITIRKRIPPGTGLAGGSSNAAAALVGAAELLKLPLRPRERSELALALGADVPFFLGPSPAWVEGVGERLVPSPAYLPPVFLVLLPPQGCSTAEVFRKYDELGIECSSPGAPPTELDYTNDLYPAAVAVYPKLAHYLELLEGTSPLSVGMTGSGSGLFAAYTSRADARSAKDRLEGKTDAHLAVAAPTPEGYKIEQ